MADENTTQLLYKGYQLSIEVEGRTLNTYGVEHNEAEKTASCWIASETDKEFSVNVSVEALNDEHKYVCRIYLDGTRIVGRIVGGDCSKTTQFRSAVISNTEERNFMFGALDLTDDDAELGSISPPAIGEIKVTLSKVTAFQVRSGYPITSIPTTGKIHERSKKGVEHQVKYGETRQVKTKPTNSIHITGDILMATLIFRYRPLPMLQANGLAPQTPSSNPIPVSQPASSVLSSKRKATYVKVEDSDDEDDENGEAAAREKALRTELEAIERAKSARKEARRPNKKVKQEPISYFKPGEVIDLTL